eukprot:361278-Chlamydomonas_euryale.AAC.6
MTHHQPTSIASPGDIPFFRKTPDNVGISRAHLQRQRAVQQAGRGAAASCGSDRPRQEAGQRHEPAAAHGGCVTTMALLASVVADGTPGVDRSGRGAHPG